MCDDLRCQVAEGLSRETFFDVLLTAVKYHQQPLVEECLQFVPGHAMNVLQSDALLQLDAPMALRVLQVDGMQKKLVFCYDAAVNWWMHWAELSEEDSGRAEEATKHLRTHGSQIREYIPTTRRGLQYQTCSLDARLDGISVETTEPTLLVRRTDGDPGWRPTAVTPSTSRTRFTVHRMSRLGPRLVVAMTGSEPVWLTAEWWTRGRGDSSRVPQDLGQDILCALDGDNRIFFQHFTGTDVSSFTTTMRWHAWAAVDVVTTTLPDGNQEVKLYNSRQELFFFRVTSEPPPSLRLWLALYNPGDEIVVECLP